MDELSVKATEQSALLKEKQKEADLALDEITKSMAKANERRDDAETLKVSLSEKEVVLKERKQKVELEEKTVRRMHYYCTLRPTQ